MITIQNKKEKAIIDICVNHIRPNTYFLWNKDLYVKVQLPDNCIDYVTDYVMDVQTGKVYKCGSDLVNNFEPLDIVITYEKSK